MLSATRLAGYEIVELIGTGATGEVYQARDLRLGREVALKFLSPRFATDPVRLARFEREARALAALGHANVAAIHGLEEHEGSIVLVLEHVPGETLRRRLERGRMPVREALDTCAQVAAGLAAAHGAGIVHRDVKPSNIRIRPDGVVKLLDFGLAKALAPASDDEARDDPTWTRDPSLHDAILGTPGYLAPEQASGGAVDRRADAWAFGCVLFEALTGVPAFPGATAAERIAAVLKDEPDLSLLPDETPPTVRDLLRSTLCKDPDGRLRDLDDARLLVAGAREPATAPARGLRRASRRLALLGTSLAAGTAVVSALAGAAWPGPGGRPGTRHLAIPLATAPNLDFGGGLDVSADGSRVVYNAGTEIVWVRDLSAPRWWAVEAGDGPFLSRDGRWIGAFNWQLNKMSSEGGLRIPLDAPVGLAMGGCWLPDESILYAPGLAGPILRRRPEGAIEEATRLDAGRGEISHRWPAALPDGSGFVYTAKTAATRSFDDATIRVRVLDTGEDRVLVEGGSCARVTPDGHLLFARAGTLLAVELDPRTHAVRGAPRVVLDGIVTHPATGAAYYALAATGDLVYFAGPPRERLARLTWIDPGGRARPWERRLPIHQAALAPDGRRVALVVYGANDKIWLADLEEGWLRQLTFGPGNDHDPAFSPDGRRVAYLSDRDGEWSIRAADAAGTGGDVELLPADPDLRTSGLGSTPRGLVFVTSGRKPQDPCTIRMLPWEGSAAVDVAVREELVRLGSLSPDGAWLAYTGAGNNLVEAFPGPGPRVVIPPMGAARWGHDGRSLVYVAREPVDGSVWVASFEPGSVPRVGAPRLLTVLPRSELVGGRADDLLFLQREDEPPVGLHLVTGFDRIIRGEERVEGGS